MACNVMSKEVTLFLVFYSSWDKTAASALLYQKSMASTSWCVASELASFGSAAAHFLGGVAIQLCCGVPSVFSVHTTICTSY